MKIVREISESLLILLVAISLVNCSGGQNCTFGGADRPARHAATTLPACPVKGGGGGNNNCSSTQKPTATLFSMNSTGIILEFDISNPSSPPVQICNAVGGTLGILAIAQPTTTPPFLYVLNASGATGTIGAFAIAGGSSATLTAVAGQPFPISTDTFTTGVRIRTDPQGQFVFVTNEITGKIHVFQIDLVNQATLGALTEVAGSPFSAVNPTSPASVTNPSSIAVDFSDFFAYVTDPDAGNIYIFNFDSGTGQLTQTSTLSISTGNGDFPNFAHSAITNPGGLETLYTANTSSVSAYNVVLNGDGTSSLTPIAGSPYQDAATDNIEPVGIAIDGGFSTLYVLSANSNGILGYTMDSTGRLTVTGPPSLAGTSVHDITIRVETLYVQEGGGVGFGGTINPFTINTTTGALTAVTLTPATTFTTSTNIVTASTQ